MRARKSNRFDTDSNVGAPAMPGYDEEGFIRTARTDAITVSTDSSSHGASATPDKARSSRGKTATRAQSNCRLQGKSDRGVRATRHQHRNLVEVAKR
jgi:hypothetical protein